MGNCCASQGVDESNNNISQVVDDLSNNKTIVSQSESSTVFSTPGNTGISRGNSNGGAFSVSSSSAGQSQASVVAANDAVGLDGEVVPSDAVTLDGEVLPAANLKEYSFMELKSATRNFKSDMVLGIGGFGTVFKGWVDPNTLAPSKSGSDMVVAIKKLNQDSVQGFAEWQSEVKFLGRLSHPNLVKLLGYCYEEKELLLVYEFMPRGSLENHLFRRSSVTDTLSWDARLRIAIGAAQGLAFLHTSEKHIIYRDFKASNILLDGDYNAKISDFGLAKVGPSGEKTHVSTRIMGTYGYAAPEYIATGHLYVKSDVYGFGVVLLEMLTGLRALDMKRPNGHTSLVDWLKPQLSNKSTRQLKSKTKSIMDIRMEGQYSSKAALEAVQLTLRCLKSEPKKRPSMAEVVRGLVQIQTIQGVSQVSTPRSTHSSIRKGPSRHQSSHNGSGR